MIGTIIAIMRVSPVAVFRSAGTALRHAGTQHASDVDRVLLRLRVLHHLAVPDQGTGLTHRRTELPLGVLWARGLPRGLCRQEALRSGINTVSRRVRPSRYGPSAWISAKPCPMWCAPQAFRGAIAPLGNVLIALTKNTTVVWPPLVWPRRLLPDEGHDRVPS